MAPNLSEQVLLLCLECLIMLVQSQLVGIRDDIRLVLQRQGMLLCSEVGRRAESEFGLVIYDLFSWISD